MVSRRARTGHGVSTEPCQQMASISELLKGMITSVTENSPAAKGGLKRRRHPAVDGEKVYHRATFRAINKKQEGSIPSPWFATATRVRSRDTGKCNSGSSDTHFVIPRIEIRSSATCFSAQIVVPATPQINVVVPRRVIRPRGSLSKLRVVPLILEQSSLAPAAPLFCCGAYNSAQKHPYKRLRSLSHSHAQ